MGCRDGLDRGMGAWGSGIVVVECRSRVSGAMGLQPCGTAGRNGERYAYISERWDGTLDDTALLHALDEMKRPKH